MGDTTEWGWVVKGELPHGPFPSREAAVANARTVVVDGPNTAVQVGAYQRVVPVDYAPCRVDYILDAMSDALGEVTCTDDTKFKLVDGANAEQAQTELNAAFEEWLCKWVQCSVTGYADTEFADLIFFAKRKASEPPDREDTGI